MTVKHLKERGTKNTDSDSITHFNLSCHIKSQHSPLSKAAPFSRSKGSLLDAGLRKALSSSLFFPLSQP